MYRKIEGKSLKLLLALILHGFYIPPLSDVMLASVAIWAVPQEFIKSLQPCYYPRISYFYLSEVIISIPNQTAKLRNLNVSLQLEKAKENPNITRGTKKTQNC